MKKIVIIFLLFFSLFFNFLNLNVTNVFAEEENQVSLNSSYYILMELNSKQIIVESNSHEKLFPASMTKMMGMLLILEGIEDKVISFDDEVICSEYASSMGGTQIYLEPGEKMKLEDLFKAVAINSANDAIVCLGEHLAGSNSEFVKMMNQKAKELKMNDTNFKNATGFDDEEHYSSPYDMAILACELLKFEPIVLKYSSLKEAYIRENTSSPFWLVNTNKLLGHYDGLDGLKTGYTSKAGYNLTATCKRNGVRLISVVMHEKTIKERSNDTISLFDYGFSLLKSEILFTEGDVVSKCNFNNTLQKDVNIIVREDIYVVLEKKYKLEDIIIKVEILKTSAPIMDNEVVGNLIVETPCNKKFVYNLYCEENVEMISFFEVLLKNFELFFR